MDFGGPNVEISGKMDNGQLLFLALHWPFSNQFQNLAHFGLPILLYILNGKTINNLQNVLSSKNWPTNF